MDSYCRNGLLGTPVFWLRKQNRYQKFKHNQNGLAEPELLCNTADYNDCDLHNVQLNCSTFESPFPPEISSTKMARLAPRNCPNKNNSLTTMLIDQGKGILNTGYVKSSPPEKILPWQYTTCLDHSYHPKLHKKLWQHFPLTCQNNAIAAANFIKQWWTTMSDGCEIRVMSFEACDWVHTL